MTFDTLPLAYSRTAGKDLMASMCDGIRRHLADGPLVMGIDGETAEDARVRYTAAGGSW